ncbi:unnamed protein product [Toxocara canis]|uniref:Ion_trans_2 domain-containing protein n=1 Tax=Toxocara canis TaxID=6265 RepID=A0A183U1Y8_TOXCA|nr:unnamed protein product [Toxocara canis]
MFSNPISASVFEKEAGDLWTISSAILFTATSIVPVGYGIVAPVTPIGRFCLIVYAICGIPLALATMANLGKFVCSYLLKFIKKESIILPSIIFVTLLVLYPLLGSLIICYTSSMSWLDSIYFCIMTIFMIGYGDMGPPIPIVFLLIYVVVGVMLVTISIDVVGADIIHHIHFMGRQVGKARIVAEKMVQIAQKISINKGLGMGMAQLGAFAKFGALVRIDQEEGGIPAQHSVPPIHELKLTIEGVDVDHWNSHAKTVAFMPEIDDLDFVDKNLEALTPVRTPRRNSNTLSLLYAR